MPGGLEWGAAFKAASPFFSADSAFPAGDCIDGATRGRYILRGARYLENSAVIHTSKLEKKFKTFHKEPGVRGSIKSLFRREYQEKIAVSDFDLTVKRGELIGLIGPNGAGKTTLVKMLTGIIAPTSGEISVLGYYPNSLKNEFKRQYAIVMGQKSQLFFELTAADTFRLFKEIYSIPDDVYERNLSLLTELMDVGKLADVQVRTLSLGERMKLELIAALIHDPKVLFLDEPTIGLDAVAQRRIREFLHEINREKGTTIVLTSHYMEDIKSLCRRCVVINGGQKIYDGETAELFAKYQRYKKITFTLQNGGDFLPPERARIVDADGGRYTVEVEREAADGFTRGLIERDVTGLTIEEEDIGGIVERIYGEGGSI